MSSFEVARVGDLERIYVAGVQWRPIRRRFGITAFGINAYAADAHEQLIEEHDEAGPGGAGGHEEIYVVLRGRAEFRVDGERVDAPAGTLVFCRDPGVLRAAVAVEDGTLALAVGGPPGAALPVSPWEHYCYASTAAAGGDYGRAYEITAAALADHPENGALLFNLACFAARAGARERALDHLRRAVELDPTARKSAAEASDLDPIRDDPRFPME